MRPRTIRRFLHGLDASRSGKRPNFTELTLRYLDDSLSMGPSRSWTGSSGVILGCGNSLQ